MAEILECDLVKRLRQRYHQSAVARFLRDRQSISSAFYRWKVGLSDAKFTTISPEAIADGDEFHYLQIRSEFSEATAPSAISLSVAIVASCREKVRLLSQDSVDLDGTAHQKSVET